MKYIWIIMIAIGWLVWLVYSVKDYIHCRKLFDKPFEHLEETTGWFIIVTLGALFFSSLAIWLVSLAEG